MSTSPNTVLVFGATGYQGNGAVQELAKINKSAGEIKYKILAVTRDPQSDKAKSLAELPGVQLVAYDPQDPEPLFKRGSESGPLFGVFSMQNAFQADEVKQGIEIADLAVNYGVRHLVWTGIDFAGQDPTPIPIFETKRQIENHIRSIPADSSTRWTILRPTGFMENYYWDLYRDSVLTMFNPERKMKMISTRDIGKIGVECLIRSDEFNGRILEIASDAQTAAETAETWFEVTGTKLQSETKPDLPAPVLSTMKFNADHEFLANVEETRKLFPDLMDFKTWLKTTPFAKQDAA